jgi:hypothetical protein
MRTFTEHGWTFSIGLGAAFTIACIACNSSDTLSSAECAERGGQTIERASCPGGRDELGTVETDGGSAVCCKKVPQLDPAECRALGGEPIGDPGDGSTHRNGCPSGETMLGTLDFGIEGGICCK